MLDFIKNVLPNIPNDWVRLTTHRLDIYNESLAKTEFLDQFETLMQKGDSSESSLSKLPTAFDYIRLGHPLSCVLEWTIGQLNGIHADRVISFSSETIPVQAVLRKNLLENNTTNIYAIGNLPEAFNEERLKSVYGYEFDVHSISDISEIKSSVGSNILVGSQFDLKNLNLSSAVDFAVSIHQGKGSVLVVNGDQNAHYVSEIQHVRRRETIAMTPANCLPVLQSLVGLTSEEFDTGDYAKNKESVVGAVKTITGSSSKAIVGSSGLSMQYAIVMGLIDHAKEQHPGKDIKIVVPPNCYGGTNDQARRVAACDPIVEVMDLPVDGGNDMVQSVDQVLAEIADLDAVPLIIAEIPTNPRVEVPELDKLRDALNTERHTKDGKTAVDPVFILDQTFCPNVYFLRDEDMLASVRTIAYVSGSKFPSGGLCTAGYCVANSKADSLMTYIERHIKLCDNQATDFQMDILAKQLPSMNQRIADAYKNTRAFVSFIEEKLPASKINFVSEELAAQTFTPSVFSLDLPTKGATDEEREAYKRELNLKLINMMIDTIPSESKYCVSYGQLKGCYWTIPATSTQGTTKEGDKDYIVRVALSGNMDLEKHQEVFEKFVQEID